MESMAYIEVHVSLQVLAYLDDLNMAAVDTYGSQPCSELLRQLMNNGGWYDRKYLTWKVYTNTQHCALRNTSYTAICVFCRQSKEWGFLQLLDRRDGAAVT